MSANNEILIRKTDNGDGYIAINKCIEGGIIETLGVYPALEMAIRAANLYMEEEEVEYGLNVTI